MDFLSPSMLGWLGLMAVPLILHLLTRRRVQQVVFPAFMFLLGSKRRSLKLLTLRQWLVMLCRMAAIGALVLAFALPFIDRPVFRFPGARSPAAVRVIIDNTPSMSWSSGGVSLLNRARSAADRIAAAAAGEDEVSVDLLCGGSVDVSPGSGLAGSEDEIGYSSCNTKPAAAAARAARELGESPYPEKRLILISDFQKNQYAGGPGFRAPRGVGAVAVDLSGGRKGANAKITGVDLPLFPLKGEELPICYSLESGGDTAAAALFVDGTKRGEQTVEFDNGTAGGCFNMTFGEVGPHTGVIGISGDSMPGDNMEYFTFTVNSEIPVVILSSEDAARDAARDTFYVLRALRAASGAGPEERSIRTEIIDPGGAVEKGLAGAGVAVLPGGVEPSEELLSMLGRFVSAGGGLLVFSDGSAGVGEIIARTLFSGGIYLSGRSGSPDGGADYLPVSEVDGSHPVFDNETGEEIAEDLMSARFESPAQIRLLSPEVAAPLRLSGGAPLLVERKIGRGKVMLFGSKVVPGSTNAALMPSFVPLMLQLARYLSGGSEPGRREFTAGGSITLNVEPADKGNELFAVDTMTGQKTKLLPSGTGREMSFVSEDSLAAGAYEIRTPAGGIVGAFAVNNPPGEGNTVEMTGDDWLEFFPPDEITRIDAGRSLDTEKLVDIAFSSGTSTLWFPVLFAAACLLIAETMISNRK